MQINCTQVFNPQIEKMTPKVIHTPYWKKIKCFPAPDFVKLLIEIKWSLKILYPNQDIMQNKEHAEVQSCAL